MKKHRQELNLFRKHLSKPESPVNLYGRISDAWMKIHIELKYAGLKTNVNRSIRNYRGMDYEEA